MIYKPFKNLSLSSLGLGAMRLPAAGSGYGAPIDYVKAKELIEYAYEHGINYYDTSYFYHDGDSERFLGKTMAQFPRESWYLASKLPGNLMRLNNGKLEVSGKSFKRPVDVFDFQMERCGVDYFDFFMLHNVSESTFGTYTDENLGLVDCMLEQKAKGRIRRLGFSSHGRYDAIEKFINYLSAKNCKEDFEFAMIQMNYMDWTLQEAGKKYDVLVKNGLSVFVMEPLRGGRLANLGSAGDALKAARPTDSHASWAFRFLQTLENVTVVLSGMSTMEQLKENIALFSKNDPLTQDETNMLRRVIENITDIVPCTSCGYCAKACPKELDIPLLLTLYNEAGFAMGWFLSAAIRALKEKEKPTACISCEKCAPLCPQNIDIPRAMQAFAKMIR